jgi:hypothetical protein
MGRNCFDCTVESLLHAVNQYHLPYGMKAIFDLVPSIFLRERELFRHSSETQLRSLSILLFKNVKNVRLDCSSSKMSSLV